MAKINHRYADSSKKESSYKGAIRGIIDTQDYSNGAYFWHGKDFGIKGKPAYESFYSNGFIFTNPKHDIWNLGNTNSNNPSVPYKYMSTAAYGFTTFMKLTPNWQRTNGSNHWDGTYRKK